MIYKSFNPRVHERALHEQTTLCADLQANNLLCRYVNKCCATFSFVVVRAPIKTISN